ncbi:histidine kinase [Geoanaerobacter pelophilus]|uniref:histidine kinase n=1 Tax=Geoanaerobacter pelophilus TaxID=60036 RepID=A0ABQ0MMJ7_9BACT|nr:histidine kinase [Geoanaerobacter pelophilus]
MKQGNSDGEGGDVTLRESDAGYRELFEENPQPMWVCHRESRRLLAVNEAALRLYGYRREQFLELALDHLNGGETMGDPAVPQDQLLRSRQLRKDGSSFLAQLVCHPCQFKGERVQLVLVCEEGNAQQEAQLRDWVVRQGSLLEAAQRELETFSYSISHDLRAPLRHIDGFSRALMDDYGTLLDGQGKEYLTRICQAAEKMSQLIDAMQQLSRVGRAELSLEQVDLSVKAQVISLELKHREPGRRVEFAIEEGVKAEADSKLVRQLLEILIGNAWKFSSKTPSALISFGVVEQQGEKAYFVRDNGAGFDMAYADKLFTVFHRLHRADEFEGSGVGLAIAQRIVARHGGRIWAESAPGAGATFYFTLQSERQSTIEG